MAVQASMRVCDWEMEDFHQTAKDSGERTGCAFLMGPPIRVSKILAEAKALTKVDRNPGAIGPTRRRWLSPKKLGSTKAAWGERTDGGAERAGTRSMTNTSLTVHYLSLVAIC